MPKYSYSGPILIFDKSAGAVTRIETRAPSKKKAVSNICYQLKKSLGLMPNTRVSILEGKVVEIDERTNEEV